MSRSRVRLADSGGECISLVPCHTGRPLCTLMESIDFHRVKATAIRDDDVILCTYPRTGTHWVWELMRMMIHGKTDNDPIEKETEMFEYQSHGELDFLPSPRILNTHLWFEQFPAEVTTKGTKLVLVYRNPKDVAVSFYNLHRTGPWYEYKGQFADWISLFLEGKVDWGSYADYLREWERVMEQHPNIPVHVMAYERLREKPLEELSRLSQFLGTTDDREFLQTVYEACSIDKMRKRKEENYQQDNHAQLTVGANFIYRKGGSGGWKNWFTVAMSERFDRYWSEAMAGSKLFSFE